MKAKYRPVAVLIFGAISAASHAWLKNISSDSIFLKALTLLSGAASAASLIAAMIHVVRGSRSDDEPLRQLDRLKKFIKTMLVLAAITLFALIESIGGDNGESDEVIYALFALMGLFPTEIFFTIVFAVIYYVKKKRYNAYTENISEDISNETKL